MIYCLNCTDNPDCSVVPDPIKALLAMSCSPYDIAGHRPVKVYYGVTAATCGLARTIAGDPVGVHYVSNVTCCATDGCNGPPPPPSNGSCGAPPAEQCCTRVLTSPGRTVRVRLGARRRLSSITVWSDAPGGPPVLQAAAQLEGVDLSVGDDDGSITGCQVLMSGPGWPRYRPGFVGFGLLCGMDGSVVSLSAPNILRAAPAPPRAVAVRLCTTQPAPQVAPDAALWIQTSPA